MFFDARHPQQQTGDAPVAISLQGLTKLFPTGRPRLTDVLLNRVNHGHAALSDIDITIRQGETVGILGGNGAGKSTLLQIILGTLTPSAGKVAVNGRVAGLLELGAGFNPLWSGRRNAEFFTMIHGASRRELDDIVARIARFAEIGAAFDEPMRTYSSGMFMRVAFAAAIAADPDIMIIDEALAVGDARFQKKCFSHFADMQQRGKTIILVSHDASLVARFCHRGILLVDGRIAFDGPAREACSQLLKTVYPDGEADPEPEADQARESIVTEAGDGSSIFTWPAPSPRLDRSAHYNPEEHVIGRLPGQIRDIALVDIHGTPCGDGIDAGSRIKLMVQIKAERTLAKPEFGFLLTSSDDILVAGTSSQMLGNICHSVLEGEEFVVSFAFDTPLTEGDYFLDFSVSDKLGALDVLEWRKAVCQFAIRNARSDFGVADIGIEFSRDQAALSQSR